MTDATDTITVLRSKSLSNAVQSELERRILYGELLAGERVNENALAAELGVSRGPIREACRGLVEAGLLTVIVNRGFFVREISEKEVSEVYDIRAGLMHLVGRLLAERITDAQLDTLDDLVERMDQAEAANDSDAYYDLNLRFHDLTVEFTENARLRAMCDGLVKELHLYRHRSLFQGGGIHVSNAEHRRIVEALRARDAARAALEMETHMLAGKARFLKATDDPAPVNRPSR